MHSASNPRLRRETLRHTRHPQGHSPTAGHLRHNHKRIHRGQRRGLPQHTLQARLRDRQGIRPIPTVTLQDRLCIHKRRARRTQESLPGQSLPEQLRRERSRIHNRRIAGQDLHQLRLRSTNLKRVHSRNLRV
jgi:hypothetical protein